MEISNFNWLFHGIHYVSFRPFSHDFFFMPGFVPMDESFLPARKARKWEMQSVWWFAELTDQQILKTRELCQSTSIISPIFSKFLYDKMKIFQLQINWYSRKRIDFSDTIGNIHFVHYCLFWILIFLFEYPLCLMWSW